MFRAMADPLLDLAASHAARSLATLDSRPVAATVSIAELRQRLAKTLPETGMSPEGVIDELVRDIDGGILGTGNGRFFGWVVGGGLPAAFAADWLTTVWPQNRAHHPG